MRCQVRVMRAVSFTASAIPVSLATASCQDSLVDPHGRYGQHEEEVMNFKVACLLAGLSFALSMTASAQSADSKYCSALSNKYQTYAQDNGGKSHNAPPADVASAISK